MKDSGFKVIPMFRLSYDGRLIDQPIDSSSVLRTVRSLVVRHDYDLSKFHLTVKFTTDEQCLEKSINDSFTDFGRVDS